MNYNYKYIFTMSDTCILQLFKIFNNFQNIFILILELMF